MARPQARIPVLNDIFGYCITSNSTINCSECATTTDFSQIALHDTPPAVTYYQFAEVTATTTTTTAITTTGVSTFNTIGLRQKLLI